MARVAEPRVSHHVPEASLQVLEGHSVVAPLRIEGLPAEIFALGTHWRRKLEFHLTAVSADTLQRAGAGRPDLWELVTRVAAGRSIGPVLARGEVRLVTHPDAAELRTLVVMADAGGLARLHEDLSAALGAKLHPPPSHVTLYSTDPARGIGIDDAAQLDERAPALPEREQDAIRRAMSFDEVFFDDGGIPYDADGADGATAISLGRTDPLFTPRTFRAIAYAAHVHAGQRRKGGRLPYLAHLLAVATLVAEDGGGEPEIIGALLHDTAEDHGGEQRLADVRCRFGPEVESIVRALSDSLAPDGERKESWRPRKERYLAHLREARSAAVLRVSNADKLHNARSILIDHRQLGDAIWDRFQAPRKEQLWYYGELVAIFSDKRAGSPLARELAETVAMLAREVQEDGAS
jgi:HD domain